MISANEAAALIATYDGFGVRRAGTVGDRLAAGWLARELERAGVPAAPRTLPMMLRTVGTAAVEGQGWRIDGLPVFDAPDTPRAGLKGLLGAEIDIVAVDPGAASIKGQSFESTRCISPARAMIAVTHGAGGSLAPVNAQYFGAPFGPPVLQIADVHQTALVERAARREVVTLTITTESTPAYSANIEADGVRDSARGSARGSMNGPATVLVTPRTSWWESTAERAGGIVAWLAALRHGQTHGYALRGFATCGHELGHIGLHDVLDRHGALLRAAPLCMHLGANLGCASNGALVLRAVRPAQAERLRECLIVEGYPHALIAIEPIERAQGEGRDLAEHGANVVSLIGKNEHFHAASDRWPGNVNAAWVAAIARAVCRVTAS